MQTAEILHLSSRNSVTCKDQLVHELTQVSCLTVIFRIFVTELRLVLFPSTAWH